MREQRRRRQHRRHRSRRGGPESIHSSGAGAAWLRAPRPGVSGADAVRVHEADHGGDEPAIRVAGGDGGAGAGFGGAVGERAELVGGSGLAGQEAIRRQVRTRGAAPRCLCFSRVLCRLSWVRGRRTFHLLTKGVGGGGVDADWAAAAVVMQRQHARRTARAGVHGRGVGAVWNRRRGLTWSGRERSGERFHANGPTRWGNCASRAPFVRHEWASHKAAYRKGTDFQFPDSDLRSDNAWQHHDKRPSRRRR